MAKLEETSVHVVAISILVLNLRKIQCALFKLLDWLLNFLGPAKNGRLFSRQYIRKVKAEKPKIYGGLDCD